MFCGISWFNDIPWCFSSLSDVHQVLPATVVQPRIHTWHSQLPVILLWRGCRKTNYLKTCWYMTQEPLKNSLVDGLLWGRPDGDGGRERERERLVIGGLWWQTAGRPSTNQYNGIVICKLNIYIFIYWSVVKVGNFPGYPLRRILAADDVWPVWPTFCETIRSLMVRS